MKIIKTAEYNKIAKKYPKSETTPYNPWAVCNESIGGKKESPEKFERCVHHIKDQNKGENKDEKKQSQYEGQVYTPEIEDPFAENQSRLFKKKKELGFEPPKKRRGLTRQQRREIAKPKIDMSDKEWKEQVRRVLNKPEPTFAESNKIIIKAKY